MGGKLVRLTNSTLCFARQLLCFLISRTVLLLLTTAVVVVVRLDLATHILGQRTFRQPEHLRVTSGAEPVWDFRGGARGTK